LPQAYVAVEDHLDRPRRAARVVADDLASQAVVHVARDGYPGVAGDATIATAAQIRSSEAGTIPSREPAAVCRFRRFQMREYNCRIAKDTAKAMKALYTTHKYIRIFVLGVPESWLVALYDLQRQEWLDRGCSSHDNLKDAKADALDRAAAVLGKPLLNVRWH
jgi:hypothetical protein